MLKHPPPRLADLNWEALGIAQHDLSDLEAPFTEEELRKVIYQMTSDKAPEPDGYTGAFFKATWDIIKDDIVAAANNFHALRCSGLQMINSANIILLPKKDGAEEITDFRPISLIHSFIKIIAKALALRLAPHMNAIVSTNQSAFIKTRSIHDISYPYGTQQDASIVIEPQLYSLNWTLPKPSTWCDGTTCSPF